MRCWCCCCLVLQHSCCSHGFRHVLCPCFPFSLRIRTRRQNTLHYLHVVRTCHRCGNRTHFSTTLGHLTATRV
ncbi:hypothetical protein COO60DRAFT_1537612 [Scenedesmus sp. NREL 46B-D3]|nr:hypothetical protein COO60DRAFT_1537612 [Scenedesmus sp. NREL 46B-D3]